MIFVNLLPSIKLERLQAQRFRRLIVTIGTISVAFCVALLSLFYFVTQYKQKNEMQANSNEIANIITEIEKLDDIRRILDIQNKLDVLPNLHQSKLNPQHLFTHNNFESLNGGEIENGYLDLALPDDFIYNKVFFNFVDGSFSIAGEFEGLGTSEAWLKTVELWYSISYIGDEGCTPETRLSRQTIFNVTSPEPAAPDTGAADEGYSYEITGNIKQEFITPMFAEAKRMEDFVLLEISVGAEAVQPGLCYSVKDDSNNQEVEE